MVLSIPLLQNSPFNLPRNHSLKTLLKGEKNDSNEAEQQLGPDFTFSFLLFTFHLTNRTNVLFVFNQSVMCGIATPHTPPIIAAVTGFYTVDISIVSREIDPSF